jgi:mercuric ion transport protein
MKRAFKQGLLALPGVGVSLLPKLTCPVCWPAYAGLLSSVGLGFLISARYFFAFTSGFLLLSVTALAFRAGERRGYGPAVLGLAAAAIVLLGKFSLESSATAYGGLVLLIAASVWNSWPRPQCAPAGDGLVQLSAKEMRSL